MIIEELINYYSDKIDSFVWFLDDDEGNTGNRIIWSLMQYPKEFVKSSDLYTSQEMITCIVIDNDYLHLYNTIDKMCNISKDSYSFNDNVYSIECEPSGSAEHNNDTGEWFNIVNFYIKYIK